MCFQLRPWLRSAITGQGFTSTDWSTSSNWSANAVPPSGSCTQYIIPASIPSRPFSPILAGNTTVPNILIAAAPNLSLDVHTLTINGAVTGTGTLTGGLSSGLVIAGNAGTIYFTPGVTSNSLKTLDVGGSVTLGNALNIAAGTFTTDPGILTVDGILNTGGLLTLKSDVSGDAMVAASTGSIKGEVYCGTIC